MSTHVSGEPVSLLLSGDRAPSFPSEIVDPFVPTHTLSCSLSPLTLRPREMSVLRIKSSFVFNLQEYILSLRSEFFIIFVVVETVMKRYGRKSTQRGEVGEKVYVTSGP